MIDIWKVVIGGVCFAGGVGVGMLIQKKRDEEIMDSYEMALRNEIGKRLMKEQEKTDETITSDEYSTEAAEYDEPMMYTMQGIAKMMKISRENGYSDDEEMPSVTPPYVIAPAEAGELWHAPVIEFTVYADGRIANEHDELVAKDDFESYVGKDALNHFGEYEDDSVYIRNERLETDFGIFKDLRNYTDVVDEKPYLASQLMDEEE